MAAQRDSFEVLQRAIEPLGVKHVAAEMKVSGQLVYKWCAKPSDQELHDGGSGARNPLDRVATLIELTGDSRILDWLCTGRDGYFVQNPETLMPEATPSFLSETQEMIQGFSTLLSVMTESFNNDGQIDGAEAREIRGSWDLLKGQLERLARACEAGMFSLKR